MQDVERGVAVVLEARVGESHFAHRRLVQITRLGLRQLLDRQ
jgi:hypothetical protein